MAADFDNRRPREARARTDGYPLRHRGIHASPRRRWRVWKARASERNATRYVRAVGTDITQFAPVTVRRWSRVASLRFVLRRVGFTLRREASRCVVQRRNDAENIRVPRYSPYRPRTRTEGRTSECVVSTYVRTNERIDERR